MPKYDLSGNLIPESEEPAKQAVSQSLPVQSPYEPLPEQIPFRKSAAELPYTGTGLPSEVAEMKWNWGAFFLPPLWCASNGFAALGYIYDLLILLFVLTPFLYSVPISSIIAMGLMFLMFGIGVFLGTKGNEIAWNNRVFDSPQHFIKVQRGWMTSGLAIALPIDLLLIGFVIFSANRDIAKQHEAQAQALIRQSALAAQAAQSAQQSPSTQPVRQTQPTVVIIHDRPASINDQSSQRFPGGMNRRGLNPNYPPVDANGQFPPDAQPNQGMNATNGPQQDPRQVPQNNIPQAQPGAPNNQQVQQDPQQLPPDPRSQANQPMPPAPPANIQPGQ